MKNERPIRTLTTLKTLTISLGAALALVACGDDKGSSTTTTTTTTSSASCCLNKSFYSCPSSDDATKCFNGESHSCERDSSKDSTCEK